MKSAIIILHGWGTTMSGDKYDVLKKLFESKGYTVFTPDLPGFGKEKMQKTVMVLDDYVLFVDHFMKKNNIKKAILIGHSFGGRIAAKLAVIHPEKIEKIVLTGAPLIRRKLSLKKKIAFFAAKSGKIVLALFPKTVQGLARKMLYRSIGEWDYYKSNELKETLQAILREDLAPLLSKIHAPTIVIWGEKDTFVPVVDGKEITENIKNAKFVTIQDATHKLPYEDPIPFFNAVMPFIT